MTVIGTAGHVDHGKSTLLQAITGRDPDRWEEEKRRGLTIDLGFVWATLPSGREVSFVDVPGHERFIKNMLAGVEAIDVALFVVAADEGWMPQSEEHLAVLDLLEVQRGVVAVTKADLVDDEVLELATLEVIERLEGTSLEDSPVVAVSSTTGRGLDELLGALDAAVEEPEAGDDPRLWVDRRFSITGAGTVVTGTLLGGPLQVGDVLRAYPADVAVRVRALESHERHHERVAPHRRVAVNLVDAPEDLARGAMLGLPGRWEMTLRFTATIRPARYIDDLSERGAFQLHVGTTAVTARLRLLAEGALIILDRPLPLRYGDRFIVRETGRRAVVAGGRVLDPSPPRRGQALRLAAGLAPDLPLPEAASRLLVIRRAERVDRLVAHTGAAPSEAQIFGETAVSPDEHARLEQAAVAVVGEFHRQNPLRPGMPTATLASRLGTETEIAAAIAQQSPTLHTDGATVWVRGHTAELHPTQREQWEATRRLLAEAGLQPPRVAELPIDKEVVHLLARSGDLVIVSPDLVYLPETIRQVEEAIAGMTGPFTVAEFRDTLGISRKYAVPLLEWADERRLTRRQGDTRTPLVSREG
ncbi:MAG TPA: selenocysteine-specific translation elongation factor [Acidimicrobiia bacterium]|jgi:selenocysteine-specific elongation factor